MKVFCYLRVSSDDQDVASQKIGIVDFCRRRGWDEEQIIWFEDQGISGATEPSKRALGRLLKKAQKGDALVCSEISRLGRKLVMILEIIKLCTEKEIAVYTVKDRYVLEDSIQSKVLITIMGLCSEIERDLLRQRTKEGLQRAVARGVVLGRPKGRKNSRTKLTGQEEVIRHSLQAGFSQSAIARKLKVHRVTLSRFIQEHDLKTPHYQAFIGEEP